MSRHRWWPFARLHEITYLLRRLVTIGESLMATAAALNAKLDTIETNVTEIAEDLAEVIESLPTEGGLTAEEVAALSTRLDDIVTRTRNVAEVVPEPEAPPES